MSLKGIFFFFVMDNNNICIDLFIGIVLDNVYNILEAEKFRDFLIINFM